MYKRKKYQKQVGGNMDLQSLLGYSEGSPFAGNPYLDIHTPDGLIDMSKTPIDLWGIDENGNKKKMKAGRKNPYKFEGQMVREIPMQKGGNPYQQGGMTQQDMFNFLFDDDDAGVENGAPTTDDVRTSELDTREQNIITRERQQEEEQEEILAMSQAIESGEYFSSTSTVNTNTGNPYLKSDGTPLFTSTLPENTSTSNPYKPKAGTGKINNKAQYAFDFYKKRGLEDHHAAGIVANLAQESGNFRDDVIAGTMTGDKKLKDQAYGVAQWRGPRKQALLNFAKQNNMDPWTLDAQLLFVEEEAKDRGNWAKLLKTKDLGEATHSFNYNYEVSADSRDPKQRYDRVQWVLDKNGKLIFK